MTTPSFGDSNEEPEYHEANFGHSDEAHAARDQVSDIISDGGCECGLGPTKAEKDWTDLMSARPRLDHNPMLHLPEDTSAVGPSPETFKYVAGPLQPKGIEEHALDRIEEHWEEEVTYETDKAAAGLSKILKQMSGSWKGEDFDRGAEIAEAVIKGINKLHDNSQTVREVLQRQGEALNTLQGGDVGQTPVPPAQFRHTGGSRLDKPGGGTHMRPLFHVGPCKVIDDERAMEMHGIDPEFQNSVHDRIDLRAEEIMEERIGSMSGSQLDAINESDFIKEARNEAKAELNDEIVAYEQEIQADYDAEVVRIGDDITHRRDQADDVLHDSPFPVESRLGKGERGEPTLVDPPPPSTPDASGMSEPGGYTPGTVASPEDVANRTSTGGGSGGSNPWAGWSDSGSEDSELSDGLSAGSGGPGLASPGGTTAPGASPAGTGPGGGVGGGVMGPGGRAGSSGLGPGGAGRPGSGPGSRGGGASGGAGRGAGGAAGAGRGPGAGGGRGMGPAPMGMMGGGPAGAGGQQGVKGGANSAGRTVGSMGRTTSGSSAPAAGTVSGRGTGTSPGSGGGQGQGRGTGSAGGRGPGGPGGMGLMGGAPGRGGGSKDNAKSKGDDRTLGSMGRPPASAAGAATPTATTPSSPGADAAVSVQGNAGSSKGASKLKNLIAAKRASESKKDGTKQAKDEDTATKPKEDESVALDSMDYEDMDIHDQQMIEDDLWGAYNKDDDQYR